MLISPRDAAALVERDDVVLLDVRTAQEFDAVRIAGAVNADWYRHDFRSEIDHLDRAAPTLVYCRTGRRSADALHVMGRLGFTELYDLDGGIIRWYQAGLPVEQSE